MKTRRSISTARHLAHLNEQYIRALLDADPGWFAEHLADEFVCVDAEGSVQNKASYLRTVGRGLGYATYRIEHPEIRVFGDAGLVHATGVFTRTDGTTGTSRYTDVYARIRNEWKVVSAQITRVAAAARNPQGAQPWQGNQGPSISTAPP